MKVCSKSAPCWIRRTSNGGTHNAELLRSIERLEKGKGVDNSVLINPVRENKMWYTYLLQSKKDKRWYTGCANDLRKRFLEHNKNLVFSTKGRGPFAVIYYEVCLNKDDAFARERYLKSGMGKRYLKNRLKRSRSLTG